MNLHSIDWLICLLYFAAVLGVGFAMRRRMQSSQDFLLAGRALPAWICALAMVAAGLGAPEVIGMGAWGAKYGLQAAHVYEIGAIPAMIFLAIFMMPLYYGSRARSLPEFLRLRFDQKTRVLSACSFAAMTIFISGISFCAAARLMQALHVFDEFFYAYGWPHEGIFTFSILLLALIVLMYVLLGGLAGAMYNQVIQFFVVLAAFLPLVVLGLNNAGGWSAVKASLTAVDPGMLHEWNGVLRAGSSPMGIDIAGLGMGLAFVLGAGFWCADFRVIQTAMASRSVDSARRVPLLAAILRVFVPFLVILPGMLAIGLPTPHTTTVIHNENGVIYHSTTVVSQEAEAGRGLVPAKINPLTGQPMVAANGRTLLDYDMATPNLMIHALPAGLLGLGFVALLASFMAGMAANVTAFNTVFTYDLYQSTLREGADDRHYLVVARWAAGCGILLSVAVAFAVANFGSIMDTLQLAFSLVNAPLLATFLLGMFWKRTTGHGAFAGLFAGIAAALLHHGLTLPVDAHSGLHGGWLAVIHHYPSDIAQNLYGAIFAFGANFIVAVPMSLLTKPRPDTELVGLVYSLTPRLGLTSGDWFKRPEVLAVAILLVAIAVNAFFA